MAVDDGFEHALVALLDGAPIPEHVESPLGAHLALLQDVAAVHGRLMMGTPTAPSAAPSDRWGHLELRESLGRGASATVYRAWDSKLGREVALKLFDAEAVGTADALREGRHLAGLRHPHLVTVYGADTFEGLPGIWMELIHGDTIDTITSHSGPWPLAAALVAGRDLAAALATLHDRHVIHGDVKARNAMREPGGRHVLMDLGAVRDGHASDVETLAGTPLYMAPEVLERQPASERSDIYSLGVLLHVMLRGGYPVVASSLSELRDHHRRGIRTTLAVASPQLPRDVTALVDGCCAPRPDDRPSSARSVEAACAAALATMVEASHPIPSGVERVWARLVRPLAATAVCVVVGAALLLLAWDVASVRNLRWALGWRSPVSPLFLTGQGRVFRLGPDGLQLFRPNPSSALPLAVSTTDGLIATMGGTPPFEQGGLSVPMRGGPERAIATNPGLCCFLDGTTDGRHNYAIRRDDTRTPGVRSLAPAVLYRFSRHWSDPEPLFQLDPEPVYLGIAYLPDRDLFAVSRRPAVGVGGRLELWSRSGRRVGAVAEISGGLLGVGYDPADQTIWVVEDTKETHGLRLLAFDPGGRYLGARDLPGSTAATLVGLECPLPDARPPVVRLLNGIIEWRR